MADALLTSVGFTFTHARTKFISQVKKLGQWGRNSGINTYPSYHAFILFTSDITFQVFPCMLLIKRATPEPWTWRAKLLQIGNNLCFQKPSQQNSSKLIQNSKTPFQGCQIFSLYITTCLKRTLPE